MDQHSLYEFLHQDNLHNIISNNQYKLPALQQGYGLVLTPGFFRFYSLFAVLYTLSEVNCLKVTHCCGSSAGALVSGFLAAGKLYFHSHSPFVLY